MRNLVKLVCCFFVVAGSSVQIKAQSSVERRTYEITTYKMTKKTWVVYKNKTKDPVDLYYKGKRIVSGLAKNKQSCVSVTQKNRSGYLKKVRVKKSKYKAFTNYEIVDSLYDMTDDAQYKVTFKTEKKVNCHGETMAYFYDKNNKVIDIQSKRYNFKGQKKTVRLYSGQPLVKKIKATTRLYR